MQVCNRRSARVKDNVLVVHEPTTTADLSLCMIELQGNGTTTSTPSTPTPDPDEGIIPTLIG